MLSMQIKRFPEVTKLKIWGHSSKAMMFTALIFGNNLSQ